MDNIGRPPPRNPLRLVLGDVPSAGEAFGLLQELSVVAHTVDGLKIGALDVGFAVGSLVWCGGLYFGCLKIGARSVALFCFNVFVRSCFFFLAVWWFVAWLGLKIGALDLFVRLCVWFCSSLCLFGCVVDCLFALLLSWRCCLFPLWWCSCVVALLLLLCLVVCILILLRGRGLSPLRSQPTESINAICPHTP